MCRFRSHGRVPAGWWHILSTPKKNGSPYRCTIAISLELMVAAKSIASTCRPILVQYFQCRHALSAGSTNFLLACALVRLPTFSQAAQYRLRCGAVWCSGNALVSINAVALHRARLVPAGVGDCLRAGKLSHYVTTIREC